MARAEGVRDEGGAAAGINVLYMAQAGYQPDTFRAMAEAFQGETGIPVRINFTRYDDQYQKILTAAIAPIGAYDVITLDLIWVAEFARKGYVVPLDGRLSPEVQADLDRPVLRAMQFDGRTWAMPFLANFQLLFYNRRMLSEAGFERPPATLEELEHQMTVLKERGIVPYPWVDSWNQKEGLTCEFVWLTAAFGGELFDHFNQPVFNRPPGIAALETMVRWLEKGLVHPVSLSADETTAKDLFVDGQAAFTSNWTFQDALMKDPARSRVAGEGEVGLLPVASQVYDPQRFFTVSVSGFQGLAIPANSRRQAEAWAFIRYVSSPEVQAQHLEEVPVWRSVREDPETLRRDPDMALKSVAIASVFHRPQLVRYQEVSAVLQRYLHLALEGRMSPRQALDLAAEAVRPLL
ncbi:extracellular solute-binding protein [Limnochorda pilosa]|uniref:ABC transporter substrate-binding protein n=1 Tax=Limnochorda pilosa TaxID=1555112 RepID=A0A0K2SJC5_LIMPI|nr:extracellular solute-binding protein [Limnochorda pilosa]BAS27132.1 ABC transporter substrate-binding protein [Limnochorda pilosa]